MRHPNFVKKMPLHAAVGLKSQLEHLRESDGWAILRNEIQVEVGRLDKACGVGTRRQITEWTEPQRAQFNTLVVTADTLSGLVKWVDEVIENLDKRIEEET